MEPFTHLGIRVEVATSLEALERHATAYDRLVARADGTLFPVFDLHWARRGRNLFQPAGTTPYFLLAWRGAELIGLAPLRRTRRRLGPLTLHWLEFWGQSTGFVSLDSLTGSFVIPAPEDHAPCLRAFRAYLIGPGRHDWELLDLQHCCTYSSLCDPLRGSFPEAVAEREEMPGYLVELGTRYAELEAQFHKDTRRNLRRSRRMLEDHGDAHRFAVHESLDDALFEDIARVHTARQMELRAKGRKDRDALFEQDVVRACVGDLLRASAVAGRLRVYTLHIGDSLAAFGIVLANAGDAVYWLIGFSEEFQQFSPSRLVFEFTYRTEIERYGTKRLNLLLGETRTKHELSNMEYAALRLRLRNRWTRRASAKLRLFEAAKWLAGAVRAGVASLLRHRAEGSGVSEGAGASGT